MVNVHVRSQLLYHTLVFNLNEQIGSFYDHSFFLACPHSSQLWMNNSGNSSNINSGRMLQTSVVGKVGRSVGRSVCWLVDQLTSQVVRDQQQQQQQQKWRKKEQGRIQNKIVDL